LIVRDRSVSHINGKTGNFSIPRYVINSGIIPALFVNAHDYDTLAQDGNVSIKGLRATIAEGNKSELLPDVGHHTIALRVELTEREREMIPAGGLINAKKATDR
jgi:aconitate hydratase